METFSSLPAMCAGNSPVPGEFPSQRPVTRTFDVYFDQRLNKRLSKQSWGWWFETLSSPLWCHSNVIIHGKVIIESVENLRSVMMPTLSNSSVINDGGTGISIAPGVWFYFVDLNLGRVVLTHVCMFHFLSLLRWMPHTTLDEKSALVEQ